MDMAQIYSYIDQHSSDFVQELVRLVQQPSISAKGTGIVDCAKMVEEMLQSAGFSVRVLATNGGNPVVYGELMSDDSQKTLLFYDHYDVQPPEPLDEWKFDPFSAKISEERIYGRGVSDNKGNIVSRVKAVEAFMKTAGGLPVNVKFVIEGEEEIGSPHLGTVVHQHKELFSSDATIWEFGGTNYQGRPEIYLGLKGVLSVQLMARGASRDVHSANAPLVPSPAWRLIWALNALKDETNSVLIEGFYGNVQPPSEEELRLLGDIPLEEERVRETLGLEQFLDGKTGIEAKKALLFDPTCTVNGFLTGYTGPGSKTVLPKDAVVKLDFRLVPNQSSREIFEKLVSHLRKRGFGDIEAIQYGSTEPAKTAVTDAFVKVVAQAAEKVYGKKTVVYPTSAASGPMYLFRRYLRAPIVSAGCSHADAKGHAPNENLTLHGFIKGTKLVATILSDFSQA